MDYENDIRIDESALDIEWLEQPRLMLKYTQHLAECEKKRDFYKEELELVRATLDKDIRENPSDYDIEKITEGAVTSNITKSEKYQNSVKRHNDARYEASMAKGAVQAFDQRKTALENMVKLHGQQYFAGPKLPRDLKKEREKLGPSPAKITRRRK